MSRRDPWADSSADEWGKVDPDSAHEPGWTDSVVDAALVERVRPWPAGRRLPGTAGVPVIPGCGRNGRGSSAGGHAGGYESARNGGDRYAAGPGYGGQRERGAASGHGATGYSGNGYQDSGYGRAGNGGSRRDAAGYGAAPGGQRNGSGYGGNGRPGGSAHAPEFTPADNADLAEDGPAGTPRPYGQLSIYTLHEDKTREFDRLAERAAEGVRAAEPDTLVYVIHVVPKAPMQRIIYEIYRDRAAFLTHERQPHIRQFAADRASCVLATNIIDLRLKYAKVTALSPAAESPMPSQAGRAPRTPEPAAGSDRYQSAGAQYQAAQHQPTQYSAAHAAPGRRASRQRRTSTQTSASPRSAAKRSGPPLSTAAATALASTVPPTGSPAPGTRMAEVTQAPAAIRALTTIRALMATRRAMVTVAAVTRTVTITRLPMDTRMAVVTKTSAVTARPAGTGVTAPRRKARSTHPATGTRSTHPATGN